MEHAGHTKIESEWGPFFLAAKLTQEEAQALEEKLLEEQDAIDQATAPDKGATTIVPIGMKEAVVPFAGTLFAKTGRTGPVTLMGQTSAVVANVDQDILRERSLAASASAEARIKQLLGGDRYSAFAYYHDTLDIRTGLIPALENLLSATGSGLDPQQEEKLIASIHSDNPIIYWFKYPLKTDRVLAQAAAYLDPGQLSVLRTFLAERVADSNTIRARLSENP